MLRYDAVVFDFDGVLIESVDVKTRAFAALYSEYGAEVVTKVVAHHLRHGGLSRFEKFRHYHTRFVGESLSAAEEASLGARFSAMVQDAVVAAPWIRGAREFLEAWHGKLPLFVASGTPDDELRRIVEQRDMARYFAGVRGSPATKGAIISGFVSDHAFQRERVLMIGDARTDFDGATVAGVRFLGVASADPHAFPPQVPVLPDLAGLEDFLADRERPPARMTGN